MSWPYALTAAILVGQLSVRVDTTAPSPESGRADPVRSSSRSELTLQLGDAKDRRGATTVGVTGAAPHSIVLFFGGTRVGSPRQPVGGVGELALDLVDPRLLCVASSGAGGEAVHGVQREPDVVGRSLFVQAAALDPASPAAGLTVSNLLALPKRRELPAEAQIELDARLATVPGPGSLTSILDVPGVQRWYDPELSAYANGRWEDLTGNADLLQPSPGSRPSWDPIGLDGKPSLSFDGSNDFLVNDAPLLADLPAFTLIVIAKAPSGQIDERLVAEGSSVTNVPLFVPIRTGSTTRTSSPSQLIRNDADTFLFEDSSGPLVFDGEVHFFGVQVDALAGTITNFEDVELDDPDDYPAEGTFSVDRFTLGAMVRTTVQFHIACEVGPVIVVDRVLSRAELRSIRAYYEERGYLGPYVKSPVPSAVPPGYTLVWDEDFDGYASADELVEDGLAPTVGKPFADSFVQFGVRWLVGNNDRCYKARGDNTGSGSVPLANLIGAQPHELVNDNLRLRFGELPPASWPDFQNRQHAGGMLSSERGFAHGPGLFEVRMRVRNLPPGAHFALWLLTQFTSPHEVEIDMLEIVGNNLISEDKPLNALFYAGLDRQVQPPRNAPQTVENVSNFELNRWHVYSFLYTPTQFTWFRDGLVVRQEAAYFDGSSPLYFLATWESNYSTLKNFPGPSQGNAPTFPAEVEIDSMRVYAPPADGAERPQAPDRGD